MKPNATPDRRAWVLVLVAAAALAVPGCPSKEKPKHKVPPAFTEPRAFFLHLHKLAKSDDADGWAYVLSTRLCQGDDATIRRHFNDMKALILDWVDKEAAGDLNALEVSLRGDEELVVQVGGREHTLRVVREEGNIKLD